MAMRLTGPKVFALTLLVVAGHVVVPSLSSPASAVAPGYISGASAYQAVAPERLADTRPEEGAFGFTRLSDQVVRVQVAGRAGVPVGASAAVLTVTGVNTTAAGYVTVYPSGTNLPTASNVNFDGAGQVMANMVTVKLGVDGAVEVYMQRPMDVAVDVSGAYVPVNGNVRSGRLVTLASGAFRVLDTRDRGAGVGGTATEYVDVSTAGVPADAVAVVVNLTATTTGTGFWTRSRSVSRVRMRATSTSTAPARRVRARQSCCCPAWRRSTCTARVAVTSSLTLPVGSPGRRQP